MGLTKVVGLGLGREAEAVPGKLRKPSMGWRMRKRWNRPREVERLVRIRSRCSLTGKVYMDSATAGTKS
jgi:hypothetical protein